jgi:hypothetical protein
VCENLRVKLRTMSMTLGDRMAERAREIFKSADSDGNGWLSHRELKNLLHADSALREELGVSGKKYVACFASGSSDILHASLTRVGPTMS